MIQKTPTAPRCVEAFPDFRLGKHLSMTRLENARKQALLFRPDEVVRHLAGVLWRADGSEHFLPFGVLSASQSQERTMSRKPSNPSGAAENPEALATFAATARNEGKRPKDHPERATSETKPIPADPKAKDEAARQVLRAGVDHEPERAQEAVKAVPDRTRPDK
jgi:hypothetical protein